MTSATTATSRTTSRPLSPALQRAIESFEAPRGFLAVASIGLPTSETVAAQKADLDLWSAAKRDPMDYDAVIERTRGYYASLVGVSPDRVATGSQTSVMTSLVAAAVPDGAEVLCVDGDFSSIVFPFLERKPIRVRNVPLAALAASITDETWLVVFSHVQSATGQVADVAAILEAAAAHDTFTFCDTTQSAGVHPVDASLFDATVCHSYKWLCSPRGVAFLTLSERFDALLTPLQAGWYAGDDVWKSCYGPQMHLASNARRFDVSPAWPAWVGAEPAIRLFSQLDIEEVWAFTSGLGDALCDGLGIPQQHQAIVTWADPEGADLRKLIGAGIKASGRAGRLRASFHLWNDESDVAAVLAALR
ncbi:aminotransferase class V-fold PLP-dependent enzyme [Lacisediminihabitans profunda]|uniref:Aminotransferase class V-fold PLP-dependent enzyme n=1 Tax=Lacisediminihabitans profunda TaxID=2594790 RepID=A0A5C8UYW3_9MICO|nr:aminotransferase class V-fold PLP-dependent enzyme [Lacisediminihabitans profunda]TXN32869.1 aminotransferase class V-fold PLP-dependent enzyme [Lacisediminihabitans profunda]